MASVRNYSYENLFALSYNLSRRGAPQIQMMSVQVKLTICIAYSLIGLITALGNSFTIAVFLSGNFHRKRIHYFLINLAVTDLTLAVGPVPLQILNTIKAPSRNLYTIQYILDALTGLTSMYSIAFISLERLSAVCWPIRHRLLKFRHYTVAMAISWVISGVGALISSDIFTIRLNLIPTTFILHFRTFFSAVPLILTIIAYCLLLVTRCSQKTSLRAPKRNRKLAYTLFCVTVVFIVTWCPFIIHAMIVGYIRVYGVCCLHHVSSATTILVMNLLKLLQYSNSCMNPFIYILKISSFRNAFWKMLRFRERNGAVTISRHNYVVTTSAGGREVNVSKGLGPKRESEENCGSDDRKESHQAFCNLAFEEQFSENLHMKNIQLTSFKKLDT